ncbi:MAG TPA: hypothetical protein VK698_29175 [Kofleriaceae bacterium]|nr:hypothetical protein [Kofleriaceae bacterium]
MAYLQAKRVVLDAGYGSEIAWQEDACRTPLTEARFLSEAAWVVLSSGMREAVVRRVFPVVAAAFAKFISARAAAESVAEGARGQALRAFRHAGKIDAIINIVFHLNDAGLDEVQRLLLNQGTTYLQTLPYIGPVTALHLAKNLGHDVAKPDRHLVRIARACGYDDPQVLCSDLRDYLGEPIPVIDIVLWRYATLSSRYLEKLVTAATLRPSPTPVATAGRRSA